jgi:hypothetical protein
VIRNGLAKHLNPGPNIRNTPIILDAAHAQHIGDQRPMAPPLYLFSAHMIRRAFGKLRWEYSRDSRETRDRAT